LVKNNIDFIKKSFTIPEPIEKFYLCKLPSEYLIAKKFINNSILEKINANDFAGAIRELGGKNETENKLKKIIYNLIKKIFALMNVDIKFKKNLSFNEIYKKYVKKNPVIIDVGANEGQSIKRFNLIFDNCTVHSFEPITKCFNKMVKDFPGKKFIKNNYALSDKNTNKNFFINKNLQTSSFNRINKNYDHIHEKNKINNSIKVKTITLDAYINFNGIKKIDILKIDTQGHELNVLKGSKKSLKKNVINFIEVEIILSDYYINKIKLYEIDHIMNKNNYELVDLQNLYYNNKNQIIQFDMLYINKKISPQRL
jgi:FkbM family methyltransferase